MTSSKLEKVRTFLFIPKSLQLLYIHGKYHDSIHGKESIPFIIPAKQRRWRIYPRPLQRRPKVTTTQWVQDFQFIFHGIRSTFIESVSYTVLTYQATKQQKVFGRKLNITKGCYFLYFNFMHQQVKTVWLYLNISIEDPLTDITSLLRPKKFLSWFIWQVLPFHLLRY